LATSDHARYGALPGSLPYTTRDLTGRFVLVLVLESSHWPLGSVTEAAILVGIPFWA
jgi:hypothetical protein